METQLPRWLICSNVGDPCGYGSELLMDIGMGVLLMYISIQLSYGSMWEMSMWVWQFIMDIYHQWFLLGYPILTNHVMFGSEAPAAVNHQLFGCEDVDVTMVYWWLEVIQRQDWDWLTNLP